MKCQEKTVDGKPCAREAMPGEDHCAYHTPAKLALRQTPTERRLARRESAKRSYRKQTGQAPVKVQIDQAAQFQEAMGRKMQAIAEHEVPVVAYAATPREVREMAGRLYPGFNPILSMIDMCLNPQPTTNLDGETVMALLPPETRLKALMAVARHLNPTPAQSRDDDGSGIIPVTYDIEIVTTTEDQENGEAEEARDPQLSGMGDQADRD